MTIIGEKSVTKTL